MKEGFYDSLASILSAYKPKVSIFHFNLKMLVQLSFTLTTNLPIRC